MKKLYSKSELWFSLVWIVIYVALFSVADGLSADLGIEKVVTAPLCILMTALLLLWIRKNGLTVTYGLRTAKISAKKYLYFLPLAVLASTNLWGGFALRFSPLETVLYVISMIGVGILEELIFRGFLFKALCADNIRSAIAISSITFGIGHIINLLNGADFFPTLLQICYAVAAGFLFTIIFHKSGSLLPCIITHCTINSLSAFGAERSAALDVVTAVSLTVFSLLYALWILRSDKK